MALNKSLYRFLGISAFVVSTMFVVLAFMLYRAGEGFWSSIGIAIFELIAGVYLLKRAK